MGKNNSKSSNKLTFRFTYKYFSLLIISVTSSLLKKRQSSSLVLITNPTVPDSGIKLLEDSGCKVIIVKKEDKNEILNKVKGVDALFWASELPLDGEILDATGPRMKTVGIMSTELHHIDKDELKKRSIKAGYSPGVVDDAVADLTMLLILATARRLRECQISMEKDQWMSNNWTWMIGLDLVNSIVGLLGFDSIGQKIAKRLQGFGLKDILYTGEQEKQEGIELGAKFVQLKMLLEESDFVVASVSFTEETKGMCDANFFKSMKRTAIFINTSGSLLVEQEALIEALQTGTILGAGLDTMTPVPLPSDHELMKLPNVVLTPHIGSATNTAREAMSFLTAQNILKGLKGEEMITPIA